MGNTSAALPLTETANVVVNNVVGKQEYTFSVADNTTGTFAFNYSNVSGIAQMDIYCGAEKIESRLFGGAGSYTAKDLAVGNYTVVFSAYGSENAKASFSADFVLDSAAIAPANDPKSLFDNESSGSTLFTYGADMEIENWVGTEDKIDWFKISGVDAGTRKLKFELEGDGLSVLVYDANLKTLASFNVSDTADSGFDYSRNLKLSAETDLFIKVTGRGADSDYSISIA